MRQILIDSAGRRYVLCPKQKARSHEPVVPLQHTPGERDVISRLLAEASNANALRAMLSELHRQCNAMPHDAMLKEIRSKLVDGSLVIAALPDEAQSILDYIVAEMKTNANGSDARKLSSLNTVSADACIRRWQDLPWWRQLLDIKPEQCAQMEITSRQAALLGWAMNVRQDAAWDHKPYIRKHFKTAAVNQQTWHQLGPFEYYYDVWSNLHYGYVGAACGFGEGVLLDGAGIEQIGSTLLRARLPERSKGVDGLRAFDDPSDRTAISMGMRIRREHGPRITAKLIREEVRAESRLTRRPLHGSAGRLE